MDRRLWLLPLWIAACTPSPADDDITESDTDTDTDTDTDADYDGPWETLATLPTGSSWPAAAVVNGRIHVIPSGSASHYVYDPDEGIWEELEPAPVLASFTPLEDRGSAVRSTIN